MKRLSIVGLVYACMALGVLLGSVSAQSPAAMEPRLAVPIAQYQAAPTPTPAPASIVVLDGGDNTFVSAAVSPAGCTFLAYIDRDDGNRLLIKQDAGDHLIEVKLPPLAALAGAELARSLPRFVAPGDKQAAGFLLIQGAQLVLYYTSRDVDSAVGSFKLKRLTIPLPACAVSP